MTHLQKFQAALGACGADAAIINSEINQRYLSAFDFQDGYVVVARDRAWLVTDFRYTEAARAACAGTGFEVSVPEGSMLASIYADLKGIGAKEVLVEENDLSLSGLDTFKKSMPDLSFNHGASKLLEGLRVFKDDEELRLMDEAQKITDAAFAHIVKTIKPDMTEIDVALELEFFMRSHGAEAEAFQTIAVSGSASSRPHGVPRPVKLEKGFLTMDFGARVQGYNSDMTRTVVIGKADADVKKVYHTVLAAQKAALDVLAEGVNCRAVDAAARDLIENAGYHGCFGHGLGHGVGLLIHEAPRFSPKAPADNVLTRGHVVTVEPGIYLEGKYGCRIEDMICLRPDGTVYDFTKSPKDLIEL